MKLTSLKNNRTALLLLILLNIAMSVISLIVDLDKIAIQEWYLLPFSPICPLYPLLLAIWYLIYRSRKKVNPIFTTFLLIGLISYGIMAYIYYPLDMSWRGFDWWSVGNMFWVTVYAIQAFIIYDQSSKIPTLAYIPIVAYYFTKDITDRFFGTWPDLMDVGYPVHIKNIDLAAIIILQVFAIYITTRLNLKNPKDL